LGKSVYETVKVVADGTSGGGHVIAKFISGGPINICSAPLTVPTVAERDGGQAR
jgi:hypothetical protein